MPEVSGTRDLRAYIATLWRWKWLLLFFLIVAPVGAYLASSGQSKVYSSSALVGVNTATVGSSVGSGSFTTGNITAIATLVTTTHVADIAAGLLTPPGDPSQLAGEVTATGDATTNFLTISAQDPNADRAADVANAFAKAISLNLQRSASGQIDQSIKTIRRQLAKVGSGDPTAKAELQQELTQLQESRYSTGGQASILQPATPSGTPVGGGVRKTLELGLIIGLLLGLGAVVLAESSDRRIRSADDLESVTGLPLLASIHSSAFSGLETTTQDEEAFQMLRTALMYFNVDRQLNSVLVMSAGEKEGKTTIATRLAIATAEAGLNVVLLDGDLRRAQVTARVGIHGNGGLGAVISGSESLANVIVGYPLPPTAAGRLRIVPAGPPPPNPASLMSSQSMQQLIRELESDSDLVIIDSPAALAVSDSVPIIPSVSGVVMIARVNQSSRQTIRQLQKIIESAHGRLLGAVATGVRRGEHYYSSYYTSDGSRGRRWPFRRRPKPSITATAPNSVAVPDSDHHENPFPQVSQRSSSLQ